MEDYNQVPSTGTFGEAVGVVNENFELTQTAINELEYSTRRNKGLFETLSALNAAIPYPAVGDWAMVSEGGFPADLYVCRTVGTWEHSGDTYEGDTVDMTDYVKKTTFEAFKTTNTAILNGLAEDVAELESGKGKMVQVNHWEAFQPTSVSNGDLWYDSTNNLLKKATVSGTTVTWTTVTPSASDMYVDVSGGGSYYWGGLKMVMVGNAETLLTQAEYDALTPEPNLKYVIYDED